MNAKERVLGALAHAPIDRVPLHYSGNGGINAKLIRHFGVNNLREVRDLLRDDFTGAGAPYTGKPLHAPAADSGINVNPLTGVQTRLIKHSCGNYWDYCGFALKDADLAAVEAWPLPNPDDFDYQAMAANLKSLAGKYAVHLGDPGLGCIINTMGFLRGMEQVFYDLADEDEAFLRLTDRYLAWQYGKLERELSAAADLVDFVWMGEDLGTQIGPMISQDAFREIILPRHKKFFDLIRSYNKPILIHTCGCSSWTYEDYIAAGVAGFESLQPEAKDMSPEHLKAAYGDRLAFMGCISTAGVLAKGTVAATEAEVKRQCDIMMPGSGFILAPSHCLQDNTPLENVLAMYETGFTYGVYQ